MTRLSFSMKCMGTLLGGALEPQMNTDEHRYRGIILRLGTVFGLRLAKMAGARGDVVRMAGGRHGGFCLWIAGLGFCLLGLWILVRRRSGISAYMWALVL